MMLIEKSRAESSALSEQHTLIQELLEKERSNENQSRSSTQVLAATQTENNIPLDDIFSSSKEHPAELRIYCSLVQRIISQIDACQSGLEQAQYSRVRNGILRIHSREIIQSEIKHGPWVAQILKERFAHLYYA